MSHGGSTRTRPVALLERDAELRRLGRALEDAAEGTGALVLVEGAAGIGKTALVRAARALADRHGLEVLSARGGELERDVPFGVARQLFAVAVQRLGPMERAVVLRGAAERAVPVLDPVPGVEPPEEEAAHHALHWLLAGLAERGPLLLAIDDAHWADAPSLRLLRYLAPRVEELPVCLLVATRPPERGAHRSALADVLESGPAPVRPLPLSAAACEQVVRLAFGGVADPAFVAACINATGGNPFLVRELLAAARSAGIAATAEAAATLQALAPESVARSVLRRLERLGPDAEALAAAASVLGGDAGMAVTAAVAALAPASAAAAARALEDAEILAPGEQVDLVHPLVRSAVRDALEPRRRASLHRAAAEQLDARGASPLAAALHLLACPPGADPWVVDRLRAGAEWALGAGDPIPAVKLLRRALEEAGTEDLDLMLRLGEAEVLAQDEACEPRLARVMEATKDPVVLLRAAVGRARHLDRLGDLDRLRDLVATTLGATRDVDDERAIEHRLHLEGFGLCALRADPAAMAAHLRDLTPTLEPERPAARILLTEAAQAAVGQGELTAAEARARFTALTGGGRHESTIVAAFGLLACDGDERLADELLDAEVEQGRAAGDRTTLCLAYIARGGVALHRGRVLDAADELDRAAELGAAFAPDGYYRRAIAGIRVRVDVERGALDDGLARLEEIAALSDLPGTTINAHVRAGRGVLRQARGEVGQAIADLRAVQRWVEHGAMRCVAMERFETWRDVRVPLAEALVAAGERAEAERLTATWLADARRFGARAHLGLALRAAAAAAADDRERESLLAEAVEVLASSSARLEHAKALVALGVLRGDRDLLSEAQALAESGGADATADAARTALIAAGARPRRRRATGREGLTPAERRVCDLAAAGNSNREAAEALFVTVKAIELHLSRSYRKLGIHSRAELADALG